MPIFLVPANYPAAPAQGEGKGLSQDGVRETNIDELLPFSFGPEDLKLPRQSA